MLRCLWMSECVRETLAREKLSFYKQSVINCYSVMIRKWFEKCFNHLITNRSLRILQSNRKFFDSDAKLLLQISVCLSFRLKRYEGKVLFSAAIWDRGLIFMLKVLFWKEASFLKKFCPSICQKNSFLIIFLKFIQMV